MPAAVPTVDHAYSSADHADHTVVRPHCLIKTNVVSTPTVSGGTTYEVSLQNKKIPRNVVSAPAVDAGTTYKVRSICQCCANRAYSSADHADHAYSSADVPTVPTVVPILPTLPTVVPTMLTIQ